jgi:hypothetical protein
MPFPIFNRVVRVGKNYLSGRNNAGECDRFAYFRLKIKGLLRKNKRREYQKHIKTRERATNITRFSGGDG